MFSPVLDKPAPEAFDKVMRSQSLDLHAKDQPPATRQAWEERRTKLRQAMFTAMGPVPEKPLPLDPKIVGTLQRTGYRIEKVIFQSRPDVWVTATAYVPEPTKGKAPAVLVVHGHWAGARRDPVVQARCLGLVKLGFFVLAVDAFGAGERFTKPALGTYHGALYGSALWPAGYTLLGMQVYDNRRAVDYLQSRPEVDGDRLGITGASGGGNQTMYAGALDERFKAVVPVCSVGTYQSYLHTACCVCEVLPGALRFCEEGDVLALVAPRALLVVNATKDGIQFSVGEAQKSLARARPVFQLYGVEEKAKQAIFESPHAYNQAMRETMYGWMTRWLKEEGDGKPIPEPKHDVEKVEDLSCFPDGVRPKGFLFPPSFAAREGRALSAKLSEQKADHAEEWESTALFMRTQLRKQVLGGFPKSPRTEAQVKLVKTESKDEQVAQVLLHPESDMPLPAVVRQRPAEAGKQPACIVLDLDGKDAALKHPLTNALVSKGWQVTAPDLRATGETKPAQGSIAGAPDHHAAEHALWLGRPLLGQWVFDVHCLLDWLALQPALDRRRIFLAGIGPAGVVALCAAGLLEDRVAGVISVGTMSTFITEEAYAAGTPMGLLAPGILRWADIPQLVALVAPRRVVVAESVDPQGKKLTAKQLQDAFAFTRRTYKLYQAEAKATVTDSLSLEEIVATL